MAMYEHYAIEDDAASIASDATILADRYDAVMADTDFRESRSVNIYADLHPVHIVSIYDEDVATFVRTSLMQDQERDCEEEEEEIVEDNDDAKTDYAESTSGGSSSISGQDARERAQTFYSQVVGKSQQRVLRWRTVLGRHKAFDISRPPPLSQQGSLLRLCSSGWQPPPPPRRENMKQTLGANFSSHEDEEMQPVPIPTISWAAGHVDGHDDDSSISFNIKFSIMSDASVTSDMDCNERDHGSYSIGSEITEEMSMLLDQFIEFEENCDYEDNEGFRLLHNNPLFTLSFDLGIRDSLDSTISDDEDGSSNGEFYSTAARPSSTASETVSELPNDSVAERGSHGSASTGLESRDSFTATECSGQSSTFDTATLESSTISQHNESDKSTNSKAYENCEESTLSEAESFSSNSSVSTSTPSKVMSPTESFLGTLTCGAMGTRELSNVSDEERLIGDSESTSSSSTSRYSDKAEPLLGNNLDDKSRASDKYLPPANLDGLHFADEMERGVEVDIDSFVLSSNLFESS